MSDLEQKNIKDRFTQLLSYLNIGQGKFEKITGIGNGTINNIKDGISTPKLKKILHTYPNLNIEWLITGEGEMLKDGINTHINGKGNSVRNFSNVNVANNSSERITVGESNSVAGNDNQKNEIEALRQTNKEQLKEIEYLKNALTDKERLIQVLMNNLTNK